MGFLSIFSSKPSIEKSAHNLHYDIRRESFFLDNIQYQHYLKHGWTVVKGVVHNEEISAFKSTLNDISALEGFELNEQFVNSGCLHNPEIRSKTQQVIRKHAPGILSRIFDMNQVESETGGTYQVKPCSEKSDLQLHQDSAVVDEEKDYCLFVWIPLCDIREDNGPLWVLSGSHLWGNTQRSFVTPWNMLEHEQTLKKYMHPVLVNQGDVVIFDPALIHSSSANVSPELRQAVTITAIRKGYQLVYFFRDKNMPEDVIDKYLIDESFFHDYDFVSRPDDNFWPKESVPYNPFRISRKDVMKLIKEHLPSED
jgi:hypothetical protein